MCGRFNLADAPAVAELLAGLGIACPTPEARYNIAPTEDVLLVRAEGATQARWWLTPSWSGGPSTRYAMFNARSETLATSRAFRRPFERQRGVMPMSSFLEWRGTGTRKQPWRIRSESGALAVAALWDVWYSPEGEPLLSCTVVTTEAAPAFRPWHHRMPVLLTLEEASDWLDPGRRIAPDAPLFAARLKSPLLLEPVDRGVGNSRNKQARHQGAVGDTVRLEATPT